MLRNIKSIAQILSHNCANKLLILHLKLNNTILNIKLQINKNNLKKKLNKINKNISLNGKKEYK
jgi:hypothetical protein